MFDILPGINEWCSSRRISKAPVLPNIQPSGASEKHIPVKERKPASQNLNMDRHKKCTIGIYYNQWRGNNL